MNMKKIISYVCMLALVAAMLVPFTAYAETDGVSFNSVETYTTESTIDAAPMTFEAVIKIPTSVTGRGGVIFGNYEAKKIDANGFEIYNNGVPRFYGGASTNANGITDLKFSQVNVCTGEYLHLAITIDQSVGKAYCYVDGELKQTLDTDFSGLISTVNPYMLGGDHRTDNSQYFKGYIKSVAVFSDHRTEEEIKKDAVAVDTADSNLLVAYDLTASGDDRLKDLSSNGNNLIFHSYKDDVEADSVGGLTFYDDNVSYTVSKPYASAPLTYEAWVYLPNGYTQRGGVILGNFGGENAQCLSFEIFDKGQPRLYYTDADGTKNSAEFSKINVCTGKWEHVAITYDAAANSINCYINGVLKQTLEGFGEIVPAAYETALGFGGDLRSGNQQYFKGALKGVTVYSDIRTAEEIAADMNAVDTNDTALLAHYDLSSVEEGVDIKDGSANGYDVKCNITWFKDKEPVTDYAYSFCVVGDTQKVARYYPENFHYIYDWILDNKDEKKIEFVFGLGDITDKSWDYEWEQATSNIFRLNGIIPYSLVRGNHDTSATYNANFNVPEYTSQFEGFYPSTMIENSWRTLSVGEVDYLFITLDYGASDAVLNWASDIIEAHPKHRVIITTHAYLYRDGTTLDVNDVVPPNSTGKTDGSVNNGDQMWDKLISKHKNIFLVMSGHDPCNNVVVTQDVGDHGNIVTQMLVDAQSVDMAYDGGVGMVTMLYFSNDGKTVTVETLSTIRNEYFLPENQMTIDIPAYKQAVSTYDELVAALKTATTVTLADDITTNNTISIPKGVTLDLAGHVLTADYVTAYTGATITDSSDMVGRLVVSEELSIEGENGGITPLYIDSEGYAFVTMKMNGLLTTEVSDGTLFKVKLRPSINNSSELNATYFGDNGASDNGITISVRLSWTDASKNAVTQSFTFSDELIKTVYAGTEHALALNVTSLPAGVSSVDVSIVVASATGNEIVSSVGTYTIES